MIRPTVSLTWPAGLSYGMTQEMTAEALGITYETVKSHTQELRWRAGAKNTTHAVAECIRRGLID